MLFGKRGIFNQLIWERVQIKCTEHLINLQTIHITNVSSPFSKEVVIGTRYLNCSEIFILSNHTLKLTKNSWGFQNCALHLWLSAAVRRQQVASRETCQNQSRLRFHLPQTPLSGNTQPQAVQSHIRQVPRGDFVSRLP